MSDDVDPEQPASEQFDLEYGMDFGFSPADVHDVASTLEDAAGFDTDRAAAEPLSKFVAALNRLESAAEEARKEVFEPALDDHVEPGESVGPVQRVEGSNAYVDDSEGAFAAVADAGADPLDVASVKVGALRDVLGARADEYVGQSKYSYYRRES